MGAVWIALALLGLAGCGALGWRLWRQSREADRLTEQIEHFLLYPRDPPEESLAEGGAANLYNQISRLEQTLLLREEAAVRREGQMVRFTENMAHQMKNSLTALQIQLDMLGLHGDGADRETLQKGQRCMDRLTDEIDRILQSSQLAEGKIAMGFEPLDLRCEMDRCREGLACCFYDYFLLDQERLCILIGEPPGQGLTQALYAAIAQTTLKSHLRSGLSLAQAMSAANRQIYEMGGGGLYQ